ncbi:MAG TPA: hypothetical protein VMZ50_13525, partial [Phycisphaerae bacterium]|nr:hypothetical protein [Phycisphaerae bacterium]
MNDGFISTPCPYRKPDLAVNRPPGGTGSGVRLALSERLEAETRRRVFEDDWIPCTARSPSLANATAERYKFATPLANSG